MGRWNGKTSDRGYGADHAGIRKRRAAIHQIGNPCAIGGEPLLDPPELLDLAHDHVNGGYLPGLSCRYHNRQEGAVRGNQQRQFVLAASGSNVRCKTCGQPYSRAAKACEVCGRHYHPTYGKQRTCSRACGVELRRRTHGGTLSSKPRPRQRTCECPSGSPHTCFVRVAYRNCAHCDRVFVAVGRVLTCSADCANQRVAARLAEYRMKNQDVIRARARQANDRKGERRGWPRGKGAYNVGKAPWNKANPGDGDGRVA